MEVVSLSPGHEAIDLSLYQSGLKLFSLPLLLPRSPVSQGKEQNSESNRKHTPLNWKIGEESGEAITKEKPQMTNVYGEMVTLSSI